MNVRPEVLRLLAEGFQPHRYACHRASAELPLNGKLDHPAWQAAPWTETFVDIEDTHGQMPKPRFRTRAKLLWNDDYLFVGAEMEEPHVWATLTEHDSVIFQDNDFEVFLDPSGRAERYFEFEINALNTTWDLFLPRAYRDQGSAQNEWESHSLSAVHVAGTLNDFSDQDQGWSVEIALPWANFDGFARPEAGDFWRINFSRVEWDVDEHGVKIPNRPEHNWVWSPQGVIDMHQPEMWGFVEFVGKP